MAQNAVTGLLGPFFRLFFSRLSPVVLPDLADPILIPQVFTIKGGFFRLRLPVLCLFTESTGFTTCLLLFYLSYYLY